MFFRSARWPTRPRPAKPSSIIPQVEGSGTDTPAVASCRRLLDGVHQSFYICSNEREPFEAPVSKADCPTFAAAIALTRGRMHKHVRNRGTDARRKALKCPVSGAETPRAGSRSANRESEGAGAGPNPADIPSSRLSQAGRAGDRGTEARRNPLKCLDPGAGGRRLPVGTRRSRAPMTCQHLAPPRFPRSAAAAGGSPHRPSAGWSQCAMSQISAPKPLISPAPAHSGARVGNSAASLASVDRCGSLSRATCVRAGPQFRRRPRSRRFGTRSSPR